MRGWQGAFFNASKFLTLGGLLVLAGALEKQFGVFNAWSAIFVLLAVLLALLAGYNAWALPGALNTEHADLTVAGCGHATREVVADFLQSPAFGWPSCSSCCSGLPKARCKTIGPLFLIEARDRGGLGLTTEQVGGIYGTVGTGCFLVGSILGATSRRG